MSKGVTVKRTIIAVLAINIMLVPTAFAEQSNKVCRA